MQKKIILGLIMIFSVSCSSSQKGLYVLSVAKTPETKYKPKSKDIGVEEIIIPKYLARKEISAAKDHNQVFLLNGVMWAEDLSTGLTNRLISFLQKKFQQPTIYQYPWDNSKSNGIKVKVQITRFTAQENNVHLEANWEISDLYSDKRITKLFNTAVSAETNPDSIVKAMDTAFGRLETRIAKGVRRF